MNEPDRLAGSGRLASSTPTPPSSVPHPGEAADAWLDRARRGDRRAYANLIDALRPSLLPSIRNMMSAPLRRYVEPEDVFQEAALAGMEAIARLQAREVAGFRGWFLGIARNRVRLARERVRDKTHPRKSTPIPASRLSYQPPSDLENVAEENGQVPFQDSPLLDRLHELRPEQRLALVLRDVLDAPWETIAFVLDRPTEMAARQVHRRARRRLAEKLRNAPEERG